MCFFAVRVCLSMCVLRDCIRASLQELDLWNEKKGIKGLLNQSLVGQNALLFHAPTFLEIFETEKN